MTCVVIIQARMGSTRLPGKVLLDIGGATMLAHVIERAQRATRVERVVLATTTGAADDAVAQEGERLGVTVYRGSEEDVLDRYYGAATLSQPDTVVRITADCPLIDPVVMDSVIEAFQGNMCDYASNTLDRSFPRGLDTEVFSYATLAQVWRDAHAPYERAHVTPYIYQRPAQFRLVSVGTDGAYSAQRWTVDTPEDLEFVRAIYARLGSNTTAGWREVLALVEHEPQLLELNQAVQQKALHEG